VSINLLQCNFVGLARKRSSKVEVVEIGRAEASSPAVAHKFPTLSEERPRLELVPKLRDSRQTQVSRQRRAPRVKASRRSRVDNKLQRGCPIATDDKETLPTNPAGGKLLRCPLVKKKQILSQKRVQSPSVRQATPIS